MTFFGQAATRMQPGFLARRERFDHERKRLGPEQEPRMIEVLKTMKSKPPVKLKDERARRRLDDLNGVTRSGRRQYAPSQVHYPAATAAE